MGITIDYNHRTKDKAKIEQLIKDLKTFAENTGRGFKEGISEGYISKPASIKTQHLDGSVTSRTSNVFYDKSLTHLEPTSIPTIQRWFSIEIKAARHGNETEFLTVGWAKRGDWWICEDWHKLYGPGDQANEETQNTIIAKTVIEMDAILEYIQKYYFKNFVIYDGFDFHIDYERNPNREFWREIMAGKHPNYARADGTYPDYEKRYRALRNHDIANIFKSFGDMNSVFAKVEGMLKKSGYGKDQIAIGDPIGPKNTTGISASYTPLGDKMVQEIHDTIRGIKAREVRKRVITLQERRIPIKRVDGITQHYHKQLPGPQ